MQGWKRYMQNEIQTSNPVKVTIMAYERCILELRVSKEKLENLRFSEVDERIGKVGRIINELTLQLNHEAFPELAEDLFRLYEWITNELQLVLITKNTEKIDPIINVIQNLLDGYREVLKNNETNG